MTPLPPELRPSRKFRHFVLALSAVVVFLAVSFVYLRVNPLLLFTEFHYVWNLARDMVPPHFSLLWEDWDLWQSVGETVSMAFLGTFLGGLFALALAFYAASNTAPGPIWRMVCRGFLALQRVAPDYAIMMIILIVVGFGPFAGTIALVIGSTGTFGKFFADAIENLDDDALDGVSVLGATRAQVFRYGVIPRVLPNFVANAFFLLEINMGGAIALGAFGGGGLGFHLNIAYDTLNYRDMLAYVVFIIVIMILIERASDYCRKRLFADSTPLR